MRKPKTVGALPNALDALRKKWRNDPEFIAACDALEPEFRLAETFIKARAASRLTQEQLAERMGTRQSYIARLESGKIKPTLRTLERVAQATGTRLRFAFERV